MNVLIIDDDGLLCFILKKQMSRFEDLQILGMASNGKEGLALIDKVFVEGKEVPQVILLDLNMPIMDGWDFLDQLKNRNMNSSAFCICILSSSINEDDHEKSLNYPEVKHFFTKPLLDEDIEQLRNICK
jgi:CheY-like chemotaxis protein